MISGPQSVSYIRLSRKFLRFLTFKFRSTYLVSNKILLIEISIIRTNTLLPTQNKGIHASNIKILRSGGDNVLV